MSEQIHTFLAKHLFLSAFQMCHSFKEARLDGWKEELHQNGTASDSVLENMQSMSMSACGLPKSKEKAPEHKATLKVQIKVRFKIKNR